MRKLLHRLKKEHLALLRCACGWVHCALLAALLLTGIAEALAVLSFPGGAPDAVYLRGLLFVVPAALCYYAAKKISRLWIYLPASVGIALFSWLLVGNPGGAVLAVVLCFFRMLSKLASGEEERPVASVFDAPHFAGLLFFGLAFFISAVGGFPALQRKSVISAVLYLLLCLLDSGIQKVESYLALNGSMSRLPAGRIEKTAGGAVLLTVVLAAALLLPAAFGMQGDIRIDLSQKNFSKSYTQPKPQEQEIDSEGLTTSVLEQLQGDPPPVMPQWVQYLFTAAAVVCTATAAVYAVYGISRRFRSAFRDNQDVVQYLGTAADEKSPYEKRGRKKRSGLFDRSPNALIRRRYRKQILRASPEPPKRWQSPAELEATAGLENAELHRLYEKARYSALPCTPEDVRQMKENT